MKTLILFAAIVALQFLGSSTAARKPLANNHLLNRQKRAKDEEGLKKKSANDFINYLGKLIDECKDSEAMKISETIIDTGKAIIEEIKQKKNSEGVKAYVMRLKSFGNRLENAEKKFNKYQSKLKGVKDCKSLKSKFNKSNFKTWFTLYLEVNRLSGAAKGSDTRVKNDNYDQFLNSIAPQDCTAKNVKEIMKAYTDYVKKINVFFSQKSIGKLVKGNENFTYVDSETDEETTGEDALRATLQGTKIFTNDIDKAKNCDGIDQVLGDSDELQQAYANYKYINVHIFREFKKSKNYTEITSKIVKSSTTCKEDDSKSIDEYKEEVTNSLQAIRFELETKVWSYEDEPQDSKMKKFIEQINKDVTSMKTVETQVSSTKTCKETTEIFTKDGIITIFKDVVRRIRRIQVVTVRLSEQQSAFAEGDEVADDDSDLTVTTSSGKTEEGSVVIVWSSSSDSSSISSKFTGWSDGCEEAKYADRKKSAVDFIEELLKTLKAIKQKFKEHKSNKGVLKIFMKALDGLKEELTELQEEIKKASDCAGFKALVIGEAAMKLFKTLFSQGQSIYKLFLKAEDNKPLYEEPEEPKGHKNSLKATFAIINDLRSKCKKKPTTDIKSTHNQILKNLRLSFWRMTQVGERAKYGKLSSKYEKDDELRNIFSTMQEKLFFALLQFAEFYRTLAMADDCESFEKSISMEPQDAAEELIDLDSFIKFYTGLSAVSDAEETAAEEETYMQDLRLFININSLERSVSNCGKDKDTLEAVKKSIDDTIAYNTEVFKSIKNISDYEVYLYSEQLDSDTKVEVILKELDEADKAIDSAADCAALGVAVKEHRDYVFLYIDEPESESPRDDFELNIKTVKSSKQILNIIIRIAANCKEDSFGKSKDAITKALDIIIEYVKSLESKVPQEKKDDQWKTYSASLEKIVKTLEDIKSKIAGLKKCSEIKDVTGKKDFGSSLNGAFTYVLQTRRIEQRLKTKRPLFTEADPVKIKQKGEIEIIFESNATDSGQIKMIFEAYTKDCVDSKLSVNKKKAIKQMESIIRFFESVLKLASAFKSDPIINDFITDITELLSECKKLKESLQDSKDCKAFSALLTQKSTENLFKLIFAKGEASSQIVVVTQENKPLYEKPAYPADRKITINATIELIETLKTKCKNSAADISTDLKKIVDNLRVTMLRLIRSRGGEPTAKLSDKYKDNKIHKQLLKSIQKSLINKQIRELAKAVVLLGKSKTCKDFNDNAKWIVQNDYKFLHSAEETEAFILVFVSSITEEEEVKKIETNIDLKNYISDSEVEDTVTVCDENSMEMIKKTIIGMLESNIATLEDISDDMDSEDSEVAFQDGKKLDADTIDDLISAFEKVLLEIKNAKDCQTLVGVINRSSKIIFITIYEQESDSSKKYKQEIKESSSSEAFFQIFIKITETCNNEDIKATLKEVDAAFEALLNFLSESAQSISKHSNRNEKIDDLVRQIDGLKNEVKETVKKLSKAKNCNELKTTIQDSKTSLEKTFGSKETIQKVIIIIEKKNYDELETVIQVPGSTNITIEIEVEEWDFNKCTDATVKTVKEDALEKSSQLIDLLKVSIKMLKKYNKQKKRFEIKQLISTLEALQQSVQKFKQGVKKAKTCADLQKLSKTYNFIVLIKQYLPYIKELILKIQNNKPDPEDTPTGNVTIVITDVKSIKDKCKASKDSDVKDLIQKLMNFLKPLIVSLQLADKGGKYDGLNDKYKDNSFIKNTFENIQTFYRTPQLNKMKRIYKRLQKSKDCKTFGIVFKNFDFSVFELWIQLDYFLRTYTKESTDSDLEKNYDPETAPDTNLVIDYNLSKEIVNQLTLSLSSCDAPEKLENVKEAITSALSNILESLSELEEELKEEELKKMLTEFARFIHSLIIEVENSGSCDELKRVIQREFNTIRWTLYFIINGNKCDQDSSTDNAEAKKELKELGKTNLDGLKKLADRQDKEEFVLKFSKKHPVPNSCKKSKHLLEILINSTKTFQEDIEKASSCKEFFKAEDDYYKVLPVITYILTFAADNPAED